MSLNEVSLQEQVWQFVLFVRRAEPKSRNQNVLSTGDAFSIGV